MNGVSGCGATALKGSSRRNVEMSRYSVFAGQNGLVSQAGNLKRSRYREWGFDADKEQFCCGQALTLTTKWSVVDLQATTQ